MIAWTPYALLAIYLVFIDSKGFSPLVEAIPSLTAKSSMLWTAVIYVYTNKKYLKKEYELIQPKEQLEIK
jgi:hypothetical protein